MGCRKIISALIVALVATGVVRADMISTFGQSVTNPPPVSIGSCPDPRTPDPGILPPNTALADLSALPVGLLADLPVVVDTITPTSEPQPLYILTERQDSCGLCLYALLGLGLCKSVPWIKRVSLGIIPGWYHEGGPFQIGHSVAISPDCLCQAPACFSQPASETQECKPVYRLGALPALWRESHLVPTVLASRGPPSTP